MSDTCWIQTYTGLKFHPLDPKPEEINLLDIAHALSMQCRYTGHVMQFYSVAQHSVHVAELVPLGLRLQALMHDASEAYVADVNRPTKVELTNYKEIESRIMRAIASKFGFAWPEETCVKRADNCMLMTERRDLMLWTPDEWDIPEQPCAISIRPWGPQEAKELFLRAFSESMETLNREVACGDRG